MKQLINLAITQNAGNNLLTVKTDIVTPTKHDNIKLKVFYVTGGWEFNLVVPEFDDLSLSDKVLVEAINGAYNSKDKAEVFANAIHNITLNVHAVIHRHKETATEETIKTLLHEYLDLILDFFKTLSYDDEHLDYKYMYNGCESLNSLM